ncbi:M14 family zinc carboxypeptidase [Psychroflexus sediminis]|uniref:Zinc carboxypeptidase n=1 Tax=Psychroflexus sediminis TaxID=470826 RepID=A0A1G7UUG5_9FLAO|nr:M14 family zinc carboxypeptidase [Psychroflexus sediminis]SDG50380.1 Zinc carboxypeptidase [Psychroflexus sediminis]
MKSILSILLILAIGHLQAQDYFLEDRGPFDPGIPSPEKFLGYPVGSHHTRHDRIVAYLTQLAELSERAEINQYGETYEHRPLVMLTVTAPEHLAQLPALQEKHNRAADPSNTEDLSDLPVFVNLGYNVHGNEPSSSEAAMLTAYILVASESEEVKNYISQAVMMIDPTINPDGRDRHSQWANMFKGDPLVADPADAEHNERWPRGRTNHYWFDLNRDWLLGINPESRGKLNWYHQWYPNVVTDFHEMGTSSTYFFEPMKANASKDPIMPAENYTTLNDKFAEYYVEALDNIGSFYFTKEAFDGTYPGYGSSYPDLQGGLGILFEQASSRGHRQETPTGEITFAFTIRNQLSSSMATVKAAVENKDLLYDYQQRFFESALSNAEKSDIEAYVFGDRYDKNRTRAFIDKLLLHRVKLYKLEESVKVDGKSFTPDFAYYVPTRQPQYRMVQTMFETYEEYTDSVFYDASAWSLANFYNMEYAPLKKAAQTGEEVTREDLTREDIEVTQSDYAYLIDWNDYNAPAVLWKLQKAGVNVLSAFKPFSLDIEGKEKEFDYGTLVIPVSRQQISSDSLYALVKEAAAEHAVEVTSSTSGYSRSGVDLGSRNIRALEKTRPFMLIEDGVSSYEAGEVWHLLDTRVDMPITKIPMRNFEEIDWERYNTMVMVSGNYKQLDSTDLRKIKSWVSLGNTLITIREGSEWAIKNELVNEKLIGAEDTDEDAAEQEEQTTERKPYVEAPENIGKQSVGGAIFEVDLDLTHPLAFGYTREKLPVYRNSEVWIAPSENPYATVAKYTDAPHIDGFITDKNLNEFLKPSASLIVSKVGRGRVVLFADNPNFRGSWYGTNRLFLNALFLGQHVDIPSE